MNDQKEREFIENTIADLRVIVEQSRNQLRERENRLAEWEKRLAKLGGSGHVREGIVRRPKGENLSILLQLFHDVPTQGLTIAEMVKKTGIPFSSVQAIIHRPDCPFIAGGGGLWKLKPQAAPTHEGNGKGVDLKS
jgi:hypothetical protein